MIVFAALLLAAWLPASAAFHAPPRPPSFSQIRSTPERHRWRPSSSAIVSPPPSSTALRGLFDFDDEPQPQDEAVIPPELRDEIYAAEANTPAAQGRQARVIAYVILTLAGVTTAFFNAFLSDLRFGDGSPSSDLAYYGFGWVGENFLTSFAFTNKIGGAIGLLGAGLSGTLAEVEIRSKKENAEKIWAEMQRRKSIKESPKGKKKKKRSPSSQASRKDMTGKQRKRLSALEELMADDEEEAEAPSAVESVEPKADAMSADTSKEGAAADDKKEGGLLGSIKGFYEKADSMAASQALLLNKELEDRGVIEKITDETGLKVVGREEAAKATVADKQKDDE